MEYNVKYSKRRSRFEASNVYFSQSDTKAVSYGWWHFVRKFNGLVVFNRYNYSNTTSRHQSKVIALLARLDIKIDLEVSIREGLQDLDVGKLCLKNAYRKQDSTQTIGLIKQAFGVSFDDETIQGIYTELEEELCDAYLDRSVKRQEKIEAKGLLNIKIEEHFKGVA